MLKIYCLLLKYIACVYHFIESTFIWMFYKPYAKSMFSECGENISIGKKCRFTYGNISIGDDVSIGENASFISAIAHIYIGSHVMFGPHVTIRGGNHRTDIVGRYMKSIKNNEKLSENDQDVIIEDDVWVGCNVTILKGVRVGKGSIIGAGSIVTKDVPPYTIHVGVPNVKDFPRFNKSEIEEHEKLLFKN